MAHRPVWKKAHGLHPPVPWDAEPTLGSSAEPGAGAAGGGGGAQLPATGLEVGAPQGARTANNGGSSCGSIGAEKDIDAQGPSVSATAGRQGGAGASPPKASNAPAWMHRGDEDGDSPKDAHACAAGADATSALPHVRGLSPPLALAPSWSVSVVPTLAADTSAAPSSRFALKAIWRQPARRPGQDATARSTKKRSRDGDRSADVSMKVFRTRKRPTLHGSSSSQRSPAASPQCSEVKARAEAAMGLGWARWICGPAGGM